MKIAKQITGTSATIQLFIEQTESYSNHHLNEKYIQKVTAHVAGQQVFEMNAGVALSHNPYIEMNLTGRHTREIVDIEWIDSLGDSDQFSVTL